MISFQPRNECARVRVRRKVLRLSLRMMEGRCTQRVSVIKFVYNSCSPLNLGTLCARVRKKGWNLDLWVWGGGHTRLKFAVFEQRSMGPKWKNSGLDMCLSLESLVPSWSLLCLAKTVRFLFRSTTKVKALQNRRLGFELKSEGYTQWKRDQPWNQAPQGEGHVKVNILPPNGPPMSVLIWNQGFRACVVSTWE
jgi:hypothetical protein